jgi:predicted RNA binding protein YcfA (HicA-like mRNA interferase family)
MQVKSKLRPIRPNKLVRILERLGFRRIRQSGSHAVYQHPDGRWTTVPIHLGRDLPVGTLRKILRDVGLTPDEFERLRRQ